jgi:hypothetical protein
VNLHKCRDKRQAKDADKLEPKGKWPGNNVESLMWSKTGHHVFRRGGMSLEVIYYENGSSKKFSFSIQTHVTRSMGLQISPKDPESRCHWIF